ncbi:hypothetical protein HU200_042411 [Digitaria exilis]|uniref:TF-B3 domain-containing protein n=1 Tax=Digitaria exilis TaxID=1010633 RepID=A0A835B2J9_9POAL|nr:hypothetical protein HU200_042411 [Digitaria exilis]
MVWRVEVGRDAEGAFLGRGWPEFAAEHGFGTGWFIVLRHEPGGGVLTVKAFDTTCCLRLHAGLLTGRTHTVSYNTTCSCYGEDDDNEFCCCVRVQVVPPRFVRKFIAEPVTGSSTTAIRFSPRGKFCRVTVDKDHTGNVFFSGGWSRFLASNGIAEYDVLLLRHEGNMVFTVNVFGPDGSQKGCKDQDTSPPSRGKGLHQRGSGKFRTEEEDLPSSNRKQKSVAKKLADTDKTGWFQKL